MYKPLLSLVAVLALLLAGVMPAAAQPAFTNGGFETGSTSGWTVYNPASRILQFGATSNASLVNSGSYAGALSLFNGTDETLRLINSASLAGTPAGALIHVTVFLKLENIVFTLPESYLTPLLVSMDSGGNVLTYGHVAGSLSGELPYTKFEFLLEKPSNATQIQFQLFVGGGWNTGRLLIDGLSVEVLAQPGPESTAGLIDVKVEPDAGGSPRLKINGQAEPPTFFFGNSFGPQVFPEITKAASANVRLIQQDFQLPWEGFSTGQMAAALKLQPDALFMPRVNLTPPASYLASHPMPMVVTDDGAVQAYPSLASDDLMLAWKNQLNLLVKFLRSGDLADKIIGYHPTYLTAGEWFYESVNLYYYDYSEANRARFQAWSAARYGSLAALNTAWSKSLASFDAIAIPPTAEWSAGDDGFFRDPATRSWMTDYQLYFNDLVADRINELAAYLKQITDDKALFCAFYGYQFELLGNSGRRSIGSSGHLALRRVLDSPNVDILASPVSYSNRQPGGPSNVMGPVDSIQLANKIQLQEDDSRTHLWVSPPPESGLAYVTEYDTLNCLRRNFGNVLSHNLAIWWMDLQANGSFNGQSIWDSNKKLIETYDETLAKQLPIRPQVALISDEDSAFWLKGDSFDMTDGSNYCRTIFQQLGAQVGYYHVQDVNRLPASVRLIVFTNTFRLTAAERAAIELAKGGGRTLLFLYAPGYVTENSLSVAAASTLTGFTLTRLSARSAMMQLSNTYPTVTGDLNGHQMGLAATMNPIFGIDAADSAATILGAYMNGGGNAIAIKDFGTWRSVFCGAPLVSTAFARNLARSAGVVLQAESQIVSAEDVIQSNDNFTYVYARNAAGKRSFQLTSELVPNGSFERDTASIPTNAYGKWSTLASGQMRPSVATGVGVDGGQALKLGPFTNASGNYVVPIMLRLPNAIPGKTYRFSARLKLQNLNAAAAAPGDYIYFQVSPAAFTPGITRNFPIAEGVSVNLAEDQWITLSDIYTHQHTSPTQAYATVYLAINGAYSADAILLDQVTLTDASRPIPARIVDVMTDQVVATNASSWTDTFLLNEQKIYRAEDPAATGAHGWDQY